MKSVHAPHSAKRHHKKQVPIDPLLKMPFGTLTCGMSDFRNALKWHVEKHGSTFADIARVTGVSKDVLKKINTREDASTNVENGLLIASYYGKTVNEFLAMSDATDLSRVTALLELLSPEERQLLESQIRGILSQRAD